MKCEEFKADLHDYFFGLLASGRVAEMDRHAEGCGPCGDLMRLAREISCRDFVAFLDDYLDGELLPERRAVFDRHLAICPDCTAYIDSYRKTRSLGIEALRDSEPVPGVVPEALIKAILAARGS